MYIDPMNMRQEENVITIYKLNHPKCVSNFISCMYNCIKKGYEDIHIKCFPEMIYPNACTPIAGIIDYYRQNGVDFSFEYMEKNSFLEKCSFERPLSYSDQDDLDSLYARPLNKIYKFNSSLQTAKLSHAYKVIISQSCECGKGVLESIDWCINEVMDNVLLHSEKQEGYIMVQCHPKSKQLSVCVFDSGIGIFNSLKHSKHHPTNEIDALTLAIQEGIGDGKGQGNGLYGLYESVLKNGGQLSLTSGQSSIMLNENGVINKYDRLPYLNKVTKSTIVDFQLKLSNDIDLKSIFSSIGGLDPYDPRIDDMLNDTGDIICYNVYEHAQGTGTRDAGEKLRYDVLNIFGEENKRIILDFSQVLTVSSSFIDEFIGKLVIRLGFVRFNNIIVLSHMNENVKFLCERSVYMRIYDEWKSRSTNSIDKC